MPQFKVTERDLYIVEDFEWFLNQPEETFSKVLEDSKPVKEHLSSCGESNVVTLTKPLPSQTSNMGKSYAKLVTKRKLELDEELKVKSYRRRASDPGRRTRPKQNYFEDVGFSNSEDESNEEDFHVSRDRNTKASKKFRKRTKKRSSKYRGVSKCSNDGKWQVRIRIGPVVKYLGRFESEIQAAECYDVAAEKYHGNRATYNFKNKKVQQL